MPSFSKPDPGKYRITAPNVRTVNDYLARTSVYDANTNVFTSRPTLGITINGQIEEVGVYGADNHLLCVYPIPAGGRTNAPNRRLYFVLTCIDASRGMGATWTLQSGQLVALDDGDQRLLKAHGPASIVSRILQS